MYISINGREHALKGKSGRQQVDQQCGQSLLKSFWQILSEFTLIVNVLSESRTPPQLSSDLCQTTFYLALNFDWNWRMIWVFATAYGTLKWPIAFSFGTDKHVEIEGRRCWMCAGMSKLTGCVCAANRFKPRHFGHLICIIWNHVNDQRTALLCFALFNPAAAPSFCTFKGPLWHNN